MMGVQRGSSGRCNACRKMLLNWKNAGQLASLLSPEHPHTVQPYLPARLLKSQVPPDELLDLHGYVQLALLPGGATIAGGHLRWLTLCL